MPMTARPRRRMLLALAAAAVVGAAGGLTVALVRPVTYTATGTVYVSTSQTVVTLSQPPTFAQQVRSAYADVATAPIVLQPVIDRLHLDTSVAALAQRVSVSSPADTVLLDIGVTDASASRAAMIANAVQDRLVAVSSSLTPSTTTSNPPVVASAVRRAVSTPSGPAPVVVVLVGALAGVLVWALVLVVVLIRRMPPRPPGQTAPSLL